MGKNAYGPPDKLASAIHILYIILFLIVVIQFVASSEIRRLCYVALLLILACLAAPFVLNALANLGAEKGKWTIIILLSVCVLVKLAWVLIFRTEPASDYYTFYETAVKLSKSWQITDMGDAADIYYLAVFPHIMGYATFLSLFYKVFGTGLLVAPIVNVLLSAISMFFIYYIATRLLGNRAGIIASILWIFLPSQTIYNTMVLSEPYYTTLILAFFICLIKVSDAIKASRWVRIFLLALASGVLLALVNATRPLSVILIIAMVISLVINVRRIDRKALVKKCTYLAVTALLFIASIGINSSYCTSRLGQDAAGTAGYSIYVGFNEDASGSWNAEDAGALEAAVADQNGDAEQAQEQMLEVAKSRIFEGNINFPKLFLEKIGVLWAHDSMAYYYSDIGGHEVLFVSVLDAYFYFTIIFSIVGLIAAIRRGDTSLILILVLYVLGLTAAHMLVEVSARYHYSAIVPILILSASGLSRAGRWKRIRSTADQAEDTGMAPAF